MYVLSDLLGTVVSDVLVEVVERLFQRLGWLEAPGESATESIDERIAKIDAAKANLVEVLAAIDELRDAAEQNRHDAEAALRQLERLERDKSSLEEELAAVRGVIDTDVNTFKRIAGIPSENDIRRERVLGFITGVASSVVASGVVWLIVQGVQLMGNSG